MTDKSVLPTYLQRTLDNKPSGGDNATVYADEKGWACQHQDGSTELLVELPGLLDTLCRYAHDKYGKPLEPGAIVSTNITLEILNLLSVEDIALLGRPLGIQETERNALINALAEKLHIK